MVAWHREQFSMLQKRREVGCGAIIIILFAAHNSNRKRPTGNFRHIGINERIQNMPQRRRITTSGFQESFRHPCGGPFFMLPQIVEDMSEMRTTIAGLGQAFESHA